MEQNWRVQELLGKLGAGFEDERQPTIDRWWERGLIDAEEKALLEAAPCPHCGAPLASDGDCDRCEAEYARTGRIG